MDKSYKFIISIATISSLIACGNNSHSSSHPSSSFSSEFISSSSTVSSSEISTTSSSEISLEESTPSSESSSYGENKTKITYSEAYDILQTALYKEVNSSSTINAVKKSVQGGIVTTDTSTISMHVDGSSSTEGRVVENTDGVETKVDTYKGIKQTITDLIEVDGIVNSYKMFVDIKDYQDDVFNVNAHRDVVSKLYVVESEEAAILGGLSSSSQYILESEVKSYQSALVSYEIGNFISGYFDNNIYCSDLYMNVERINQATIYSLSHNYSYDGDMNDIISETNSMSFTINDEGYLINALYSNSINDVSKEDASDAYLSELSYQYDLIYEERNVQSDNILNPNDYFLESILDVEIKDTYGKVYESDNIPSSTAYIVGWAKDYLPLKASNIALVPISSSNPDVVSLSTNTFKVNALGTSTLTFSYFGKENGVYKQMIVTKDITIVQPTPTSITFLPNPDVDFNNNTIVQGNDYIYRIFASPKESNQLYDVTVSDPSIIKTSIDEENNLHIIGLVPGSATVKITSKVDETIFAEKTFNVQAYNLDFASIITSQDYHFNVSTSYGYTMDMHFDTDGTGYRDQTVTSTNRVYRDTFTYRLEENNIIFTSWGESTPEMYCYDRGIILDNGDKINCEVDSTCASYGFNAVK